MKNKIVCLFNKIRDCIHSDRFIDVGIPLTTLTVILIVTVVCIIFSPLSASAAEFPFVIRATYYDNGNYSPIPGIEINALNSAGDIELYDDQYSEIASYGYIGYVLVKEYEGDYYFDGEFVNVNGDITPGLYGIVLSIINAEYQVGPSQDNPFIIGFNAINGIVYTIGAKNFVTYDEGEFFTVHCLEYIGDLPSECPTLEQQIADYNGSWVQFINMVRQNNAALGNAYQSVVDEAIVAGKISVQGNFINFDGTYDELLALLMTTSNNNPNIQAVLEQELQRQFENGAIGGYDNGYSDGKDYGQEVGYDEGYKIGHHDGYNLAASESFGENLLGDLLNAPMNALNKWVLYTAPNGTVVTMGGVFGALIALTIFVIFLRMFAGG